MIRALMVQVVVALGAIFFLWTIIQAIDLPRQYTDLGDQYTARQEYDLAAQSYGRAIEHGEESLAAYKTYVAALLQAGDNQTALQALQQALPYDPLTPARLHLRMAWIHYGQQTLPEAQTHFATAYDLIQANPGAYSPEDRASALTGQGWVAYLVDGCAAARPFFEQAQPIDPDLPILQRGLRTCPS